MGSWFCKAMLEAKTSPTTNIAKEAAVPGCKSFVCQSNLFIRTIKQRITQAIALTAALCFIVMTNSSVICIEQAQAKPVESVEKNKAANQTQPVRRTDQIYFATTRLNKGSEKSPKYSGDRHLDMGSGSVEYGIVGIEEPEGIKSPASASSGKEYKKRMRSNADAWRKTEMTFVSKTDGEEFYKRIREWPGQICVYIHGYDKPFDEAVQDACMLYQDYQQYEGNNPQKKLLPILFTWPSVGGRTEYGTDEANLEWSTPFFDQFLDRIMKEKNPSAQISVVAHSMGVRMIVGYLSKDCALKEKPLFQNLFLCSGDVDFMLAETKKQLLEDSVANKVYCFVSDRDKALILSHIIHEQPRLGRPIDPPKYTRARGQVFTSAYLEQIATDTSDLLAGNDFTEPPDVQRWLANNPSLDREFGDKAIFIDVTDLVTKDFGHGTAYSVIASYMAGQPIRHLKEQIVHKRPDRTTLIQSGGTPKHLYRFHRLMPHGAI